MKLLVIAGNHLRHRAFVNTVAEYTDIAGLILVCREDTRPTPPEDLTAHLKGLWDTHFMRRYIAEQYFFGAHRVLKTNFGATLSIDASELNSQEVLDWYKEHEFDAALILGVPVIKDPLFSALPTWKVNLHLGLIPHFKGSITMFWPFLFLKPHWAGLTYHVMGRLVDTGMIIHQIVPELVRGDGIHDVACRASMKAYEHVEDVLRFMDMEIGLGVEPTIDPTLEKKGKLFKKSDWHAGLLRPIYETYRDRIVDAYLDGEIPQTPEPDLISLLNA